MKWTKPEGCSSWMTFGQTLTLAAGHTGPWHSGGFVTAAVCCSCSGPCSSACVVLRWG